MILLKKDDQYQTNVGVAEVQSTERCIFNISNASSHRELLRSRGIDPQSTRGNRVCSMYFIEVIYRNFILKITADKLQQSYTHEVSFM